MSEELVWINGVGWGKADPEEAEQPRPEPEFRVFLERATNKIADRIDITDAVMDVYDIAINSMDFGSGFLSTEEVGNLRALGKAIGAEQFDYQHDKCLRCGHNKSSSCHNAPGFRPVVHRSSCCQCPACYCACTGFINSAYSQESVEKEHKQ